MSQHPLNDLRAIENDEYGAFARRVLNAYARRVVSGDVEALGQMTTLAADLDEAIGQAVTGLREFGYSWAEIGLRLGITRQAAQQRWGQSCHMRARTTENSRSAVVTHG
jgi:hypothetical protein